MLRGYLILIRFVAVIVISILASLFWNTLYIAQSRNTTDENGIARHDVGLCKHVVVCYRNVSAVTCTPNVT